jgi:hypothetical protein
MWERCAGEMRTRYSSAPRSVCGRLQTMPAHERGDYASSRIIAALREVDAALSGLSLVEEVKETLAEVNREVRARAATIGPSSWLLSKGHRN